MEGRIINIQHFSVHDGPGIRTTIFLKGCPLKCRWCANPESQNFCAEPAWSYSKCIGCKACIKAFGCELKSGVISWKEPFEYNAFLRFFLVLLAFRLHFFASFCWWINSNANKKGELFIYEQSSYNRRYTWNRS